MNRRTDDPRSDRDGLEPDGLSPLVRQWPDEAPPAWLDANIRSAAHDAARIAGQKAATPGPGATGHDGKGRPAAPVRWNRWLPLGGTLATAVLAVLLMIARPGGDHASDPAEHQTTAGQRGPSAAPEPPAAAPATPAMTAPAREPNAASRPSAAASRPSTAADAARSKQQARDDDAARSYERRLQQQSAAPVSPAADQAARVEPPLPDSGEACVRLLESLSRERRSDEGRRMLSRCRDRFPDHPIPPSLERALQDR